MAKRNEKYKLTVAEDGITISKNNNHEKHINDYEIKQSYATYWGELDKRVRKDKKEDLQKLIEKSEKENYTDEQLKDETNKIFIGYLSENPIKETKKLTNQFKKDKINITVTHIKIKKVSEQRKER